MKVITLTIPEDLLKKVDLARSDVPRARFIRRAIERALKEKAN